MMSLFIGTALAADAAKADGESSFPPFDASTFPGQIFWLVITFGLLYYLMSKIALPRVEDILKTRAARIDNDLQVAAAMQEKAKLAGEAYEKLLADARANAQAIGQKAKDEAARVADDKRKQVEADMASKVAASEASITTARDKAMGNVASIAEGVAADIVKRLSGVAPSADDIKKAVASARA